MTPVAAYALAVLTFSLLCCAIAILLGTLHRRAKLAQRRRERGENGNTNHNHFGCNL